MAKASSKKADEKQEREIVYTKLTEFFGLFFDISGEEF